MATRLYAASIDPSFLLNLQAIDAGDLVTPDGRSHPITGLSALDQFTGSSAAVGVTSDPAPQTGPTYNPGGTVNPGGAGTAPTWQDFFNAAAGYIGGGNASTSAGGTGAAASSSQTGTHFGVPHLGIRLIAGTIGVGILLIVAARLVFRD